MTGQKFEIPYQKTFNREINQSLPFEVKSVLLKIINTKIFILQFRRYDSKTVHEATKQYT